MISKTPPGNNLDSYSDKSDKAMNQLENINQLKNILESSVEEIAKLIVTKSWVRLLLLLDAVWILFFSPKIVSEILKSIFNITDFSEKYSDTYWVIYGLVAFTIFLIALVIAVRTIQR